MCVWFFPTLCFCMTDMQQNNNNSLIGKQPLENGHRRQYETLVKLLSSTLPVRNKCLCGVSRSSSVVSNRSASSPVSPISPQSYRSQSSMSMGESHTSSPEMTWVRQAMVKYWYNWLFSQGVLYMFKYV